MADSPVGLEGAPLVDRVKGHLTLGGERDVSKSWLASVSVSFHYDKGRPRTHRQVPQPQTCHCCKPEGAFVNDECNGSGMRATVRAGRWQGRNSDYGRETR